LSVRVHKSNAQARGRLIAIRLTMLTLRMMENWRRNVSDHDSIMILLAVVAITGERLTRCALEPHLERLAEPMPAEQLSPCNISSLAAATGLNRETARRKVNALIERGFLVKSADGSINYKGGHLQQDHVHEMVREQLDAVVRLTNDLCRDGTLVCDPRGCSAQPGRSS
jgi:hypothetical protein